MAQKNTKQMLFEMMGKVNPDFVLNEEADRSSYSSKIYDDIKVLMGNRDALSDNEIQQIATSHGVDPTEVVQTVDYVVKEKGAEPSLPNSSAEAEEVNDFFKFLANNPQKGTIATVEYVSMLDRYLAKPKSNPMFGKFMKLTKYGFEWERTYGKEVEKVNPEWELQARKGDYTKMEGGYGDVMERDARGDEVLPIVPRSPKSIILVIGEDGNVADTVSTKELKEKYAEYFRPSFITPSEPATPGSGVDFRPLKLYAINRIAAGGKEWINNKLKPEFEKYREYFKELPK